MMNEGAVKSAYATHFGAQLSPKISVCAPGRVNLIGEHVDYNDGFVLPCAIPLCTFIYGDESQDGSIGIFTMSDDVSNPLVRCSSAKEFLEYEHPASWIKYLRGVFKVFHVPVTKGLNIVIWSSVPLGSGLSSSASLEVAFYTFLERLMESEASSFTDKALRCQRAENEYAGVPCGNMDQLASVFGRSDHALLIDCRSLEVKYTPLTAPDVIIMIINSNVKHELQGSEYSDRRAMCEKVARCLKVNSLREANMDDLNRIRPDISEDEFRKGRHVITEIRRTQEAHSALERNDYKSFGELMIQSHESLRDDFGVSCPELNFLVDSMKELDGVYGSRMTGGGFGGCTVSIVHKSKAENIKKFVVLKYEDFFGKSPSVFICKPGNGARAL